MVDKFLIKLENVSKDFTGTAGAKRNVLEDINLELLPEDSGNIISLLSSFGSGKSTLLKIIAGLENPSEGTVLLGHKFSKERNNEIIYIPEKPSSFPWLNVEENIKFALKEVNNKNIVKEFIDMVGLSGYENHHPNNKSLGFRFRITLARALAVQPKLILLDDPFKRMSNETKDEIYGLVKSFGKKYNIAMILGTSNISEAVYLSNRIYLMKKNPGIIFNAIEMNAETMKERGLSRLDRFISLKNEIEKLFSSAGENFHSQ